MATMVDVHDTDTTSFPMPVSSEDTASEEIAGIVDWSAEELPSMDELLELRFASL